VPTCGQGLLKGTDLVNHDLPAGGLAPFGLLGGRVGALLLVGLGNHPEQVGMIARQAPLAVLALPAGMPVRGRTEGTGSVLPGLRQRPAFRRPPGRQKSKAWGMRPALSSTRLHKTGLPFKNH
jgi:hypothetical protein